MMPLQVPPQYSPAVALHSCVVNPSVRANRSVMTPYIDLGFHDCVSAAHVGVKSWSTNVTSKVWSMHIVESIFQWTVGQKGQNAL